MRRLVSSVIVTAAVAAATIHVPAQSPAVSTYALTNARIVPVSGAPIDAGTVVIRDGLIAEVGARVTAPAGAQVIDAKGLTIYPGLIDMGSTAGLEVPATPRPENARTTAEVERAKRLFLVRPDVEAATWVNPSAPALARAAQAGITTVLAAPAGDAIRGRSALVNTALPADPPQIGGQAGPRRGRLVVKSPVALHVSFAERPGGGSAYPNSLMGVIAFVRQAFLDAQHYQAAEAHAAKMPRGQVRPAHDPALAAMAPAVNGQLPVAFDAESAREIRRGLDMARAFKLTPIVTDAREAAQVTDDLKAANARVILSVNYPKRSESLAPDADEPLRVLRARANAPKAAAALQQAGILFAFESDGLEDPKEFVKNAAKTVANGLPADAALRALTLDAATLAGAADRLGSIEAGKIANLVVTEGDLFDEKMTIKHVFVDGVPVNLDAPAAPRGNGNRRPGQ